MTMTTDILVWFLVLVIAQMLGVLSFFLWKIAHLSKLQRVLPLTRLIVTGGWLLPCAVILFVSSLLAYIYNHVDGLPGEAPRILSYLENVPGAAPAFVVVSVLWAILLCGVVTYCVQREDERHAQQGAAHA